MKARSLMVDGFEKSVAEKMPKMKKLEEPLPPGPPHEAQPVTEDRLEMVEEKRTSERQPEKAAIFQPKKAEGEQTVDVFRLIEDLHAQLLVSGETRRALEMDLHSHQKTIHQLTQDNQDLRRELEELRKELQKLRETQSESIYLKEENEDALERIQRLQQELREMNEALAETARERNDALRRIQDLTLQLEQAEILQIKGRLKEREASHFYEENQRLQSKFEEVLAQNVDLERKYESLKKSFNEVRESLTLLRDSCKTSFYNLPEAPE